MKNKIIILILLLLLLTGCSDYRELTDMAIVSTIGIDKKDDNYEIFVQILKPNTDSSSQEKVSSTVMVYKKTGKTIHEAFRNLTLESPKKLYVAHTTIVIINENALDKLSDYFDFFLRDTEMKKDFKLLITKNSIDEIMNTTDSLITIPAESINESIEISSGLEGSVTNISFDQIVSNEIQIGIDPLIPSIKIKENNSDNDEINPNKRLILSSKMALFSKDKFVGYLSSSSSLAYNILNKNTTSSVISFKCNDENYASIELTKNNSKMNYDINRNILILDIDLEGSLSELNCDVDINSKKELNKLENKLKEQLNNIYKNLIKEVKETDSDFLGLERYIYRNNYKYYKSNKEKIKNKIKTINDKINIKILFSQTGLMQKGDEKY